MCGKESEHEVEGEGREHEVEGEESEHEVGVREVNMTIVCLKIHHE